MCQQAVLGPKHAKQWPRPAANGHCRRRRPLSARRPSFAPMRCWPTLPEAVTGSPRGRQMLDCINFASLVLIWQQEADEGGDFREKNHRALATPSARPPCSLSLAPPTSTSLSPHSAFCLPFLLPPCLLSRFLWHARRAQDKCAPSIMSARRARQGRPRCTHGRQGHTRAPSEGHTREPLSSWARRCPPETRWRRRQCSVLSSAHATTGGGASPRPGHEPRTPWQRLFLQTS